MSLEPRPTAAARLVRMGYVPSTEGRNPKTRAPQRFLSAADIVAFHDRFVTLRAMAVDLGQSWQALRQELAQRGIAPFSPDSAERRDLRAYCDQGRAPLISGYRQN